MSVVQRRICGRGVGSALLRWIVPAVLITATPSLSARALAAWPSRPDSLLILHTNDIHAHLLPFVNAKGDTVGGAAARAALIARLRSGNSRTLLLDAGDVFQGTPMYNFFRGVPDYRSMSKVGYDAGALGNHELDDGPAAWLRVRGEAAFPILSANVFVSADSAWSRGLEEVPDGVRKGATWVGGMKARASERLRFLTTPYVIREVGGVRVGILGLTTRDIVRIVARSRNGGVAVSDPVTAASWFVPELRRKADIVVALTHLGVDRDLELASRVPGIDVIVGGHSHTYLWEPLFPGGKVPGGAAIGRGGTGIVQAGRWGDRVGRLAIRIGPGGIRGLTDALIPVAPREGEDREIARLLQPFRDSLSVAMDQVVFTTRERVSMAGLEDGDTPLGNFVADALRESGRADIAVVNSGGIRAPLPEGQVTVGDVYTVLPFDNTVVRVRMKGWQVRQLFDFIADRIGKRGFAQISGAEFVVRRGRAMDIRVGGRVLDSDRTYTVATLEFLYTGGDGYTHFEKAGPAEDTGTMMHAAAIQFLRGHPAYVFGKQGRIRWEGGMPSRELIAPR